MALRLMNRLPKKRNLSSITICVIRFAVSVNEDQEGLPTFCWLPKVNKQLYKARLIADSHARLPNYQNC